MEDMNRETRKILTRCKVTDKNLRPPPLLEELVATQLTEELMDKFQITSKKKKMLLEYQAEFAKDRKLKAFKHRLRPIYAQLPSLDDSHKKIRGFAELCPTYQMSPFHEQCIFKKIATKGLEYKFPMTIKFIMDEAKEEFIKITHLAGANMKAKPTSAHIKRFVTPPYVHLGKTPRYHVYLANRRQIQSKYMLHQNLVTKIINECAALPEILFNLGTLRQRSHAMSELEEIFAELVKESDKKLHRFYDKIREIVEKDTTKLRTEKYKHLLRVCTGLLSVYISNSIEHTVYHILEVTGSDELIPYMQLSLKYNKQTLYMYPRKNNIILLYSLFIANLVQIGKTFPILETIKFNLPQVNIHLNVTEEFLQTSLEKLGENIITRFIPIDKYLDQIGDEFKEMFIEIELDESSENYFENGCLQIRHYQNYITKASSMLGSEYFGMGQLLLSEYVASMKESLSVIIEDIFSKLCAIHMNKCYNICDEFEAIKAEAMRRPANSEELIAQGKYMLRVKTEILGELCEKIEGMLKDFTMLVEDGTISEEHNNLITTTVLWSQNLDQILDQNSLTFEQLKMEAEDKLAATIEYVNNETEKIMPLLHILDDMDDFEKARDYVIQIKAFMGKIVELRELIIWINKEQETLGFKISPFSTTEEVEKFLLPFYHLLQVCVNIKRHVNVCMDGPFEFLDSTYTERYMDQTVVELMGIQKAYRIRMKQDKASGLRFFGVVEDPDMMSWPAPLKLIYQAQAAIREFRTPMMFLKIMCNDALTKRHWREMSRLAGFDLTPNAGSTLRKYTQMGLDDDIDKYDVISSGATKERELYANLKVMVAEWDNIFFNIGQYKDSGRYILTSLDDVQIILDDHILRALMMRGSIYVKPYEVEVEEFYQKLVRINRTIDVWGRVQVQWLYLLPIFSSKDIVAQMPEEGNLFKDVNDIYKRYMDVVAREPRVYETAGGAGVMEIMEYCVELLEQINDGVINYLERKRLFFPRFFFLSNDEMLEILSETKDPQKVQPHLKKCFEAINTLQFNERLDILALYSCENEKIIIKNVISTKDAGGSVELWLSQVEEQMLLSVLDLILRSFRNYSLVPRTHWVQKWPGQVVLCVSQMYWTNFVHLALNREEGLSVPIYLDILKEQLQDIVGLIRDPSLTNLSRITIKALIVIDVHAKDVVNELFIKNVASDREFKWLSQMRYYCEDDEPFVRLINATVKYFCEYLGNTDRLVITPLTDRCYRTLIGAFHLHLNGAPEGPAGTGKTETTKDLAKAIAVQCVVFNCSDGLDYKAMGKFFKGLASCGAWVCFDEFNRIDIEVLSVVAQQILLIVQAVRCNAYSFDFEGTEIKLNPACYVCITMNPGYAGRSELPDNLKVLFRTVAMMVPDYALIGEISLYSYGFVDARNLAVKIVTVYRLCSEQLSSQNHYDYGMRAVKSVLSSAGNNKRKYPDELEDILLLRAILDVNLPKFLNQDLPLFDGIIADLFPGVVLPETDYDKLLENMILACERRNLIPKQCLITKVIQTYEMMLVRWGFMIVGYPLAGKTCTLNVLADTLNLMNAQGLGEEKVESVVLNPKAITMGQLYGQFDPISYEWFDGVIAVYFRQFSFDPSPNRKWMIFDGPVDAVWIENMNSVLDDNRKLCLMSGEVMSMANTMSLVFEVMDLEQASPATVSRCGMIYMEPATLGWRPFFEAWLPTCNPSWSSGNREIMIRSVFEWIVDPCLDFIRKKCLQFCNQGEISLVLNMMSLLEMNLDDACSALPDAEKYYDGWLQAALIIAGMWGLGAILDANSQVKYDAYYRKLWLGEFPQHPQPEMLQNRDILLPGDDGLIIDYIFNFRSKGNWKYLPDVVKNQRVDECKSIMQAIIPTMDTVRYTALLNMHIKHRRKCLLMGPTGTGKSFYTVDLLMNKLEKDQYQPAFITFTVQITCNQVQDLVISKLQKRRRGNYGAPKGKLSVIFIDDVNMPVKEIYGAQPPLELLRQFFDHKNWYDLKTTETILLFDVLFIGAMGLVGGSRQDIYPRFLRHFNIYSINEFSTESMAKIYSNILLLGWKANGFPSDIINQVMPIINASLDIFKVALINLRPTPSKSHYIFNLRDFSRLIQGCSLLKRESVENKKIFSKLWVHEVMRIFYDRLTEDKDRQWVYDKLRHSLKSSFREDFDDILSTLPHDEETGYVPITSMRKLLFGTFFDQDTEGDDKKYEEVLDIDALKDLALRAMADYNTTHTTPMDIVLFDYAIEHLGRICRVLSMKCGCALLIGISGSGRQSLTRLAGQMYDNSVFQPEITNNYTVNDWRDDIKKILKESGGIGHDCIFLISEGQIKEECFLQDIDCLLNSGEVPNMYAIDEKQELMDMVRLAAQGGNRNVEIDPLEVFFFFTNRCKERTHIIVCFSPVGATFKNRLRLYPALINCCTIDWFEDWPEEALEQVAHNWMQEINLDEKVREYCTVACKYFHVEARNASIAFFAEFSRHMYITSASYLELIKSFSDLTDLKQTELMNAKRRYEGGLEKLYHAAVSIGEMQESLNALQPMLAVMSKQAEEMLKKIEQETIGVEKASELVKQDEKVVNKQAAAAQALKIECEADLAEALPILEEASAALDILKPSDIVLVKSMKNPPDVVKLVMAAVCIMKGVKPDRILDPSSGKMVNDFWGPSKKMLGEYTFLQSLKDYDKDNIKPEAIAKIRKEYIVHKDFKPHIVAKASSAAEGLCKWIIAMDMYERVFKIVAPKKAALANAEEEFTTAMNTLTEKREQVRRLEEQLATLTQQLEEAILKKEQLEAEVELCNNKLIRAKKLIGGLGGEKARWGAAAEALQLQYDGIAGDILLACGIISYLSPFNATFRMRLVEDWHLYLKNLNIPTADVFDMITVLGSDVTIQYWNVNGLPMDAFSIENGIIMDNSRRWSLFIDPQAQAANWIKKMEKKNNLEILKFSMSDYMKRIEYCIPLGYPVLIENIEENLETPLDPILFKQIFRKGKGFLIQLGESAIEYNLNFKLYLTSKMRNPHYLPEIFNKVTIINFALTLTGLQEQLLGIVVAVEKPDLQQLKEELTVQKADNKKALKETEDMILQTLAESKGDILEDGRAIKILDDSKILVIEIMEKQQMASKIEKSIEEFREKYKGVSAHSAVLYYCIADLANVDTMYQYSLEWFINLYIGSIQRAEKFKIIEKRCQCLISAFTYDLYNNIARSLFEKDKLLFSFLLCAKIMMAQNKLDEKEFLFLVTGIGPENPAPNPCPDWLPDKSWEEMGKVESLKAFQGFTKKFLLNVKDWKGIYDNFTETFPIPSMWRKTITSFRRLILVRLLRPDKLINCISLFIQDEMDPRFIKPPPFNISVSFDDSYCLSPLIFILSPGVDPMSALIKFAEDKKMLDRFKSTSLGQGQGPIAQALIEEGQEVGMWICLQNCHLSTSWMPTLEKLFDGLDFGNTHPEFRLWLTSYPSPKFPSTLLQKGVKMTNEPPTGLQNNLLKSYITDPVKNPEFYKGCPEHEDMFVRLLYGLTFFHANVQERRTFGPLGWNIAYGFNDSDFDISVQQLQMFINESEDPYEVLSYLIGECNYGGRVTDDWDRRLIVTILANYLNPQVVLNKEYTFSEAGSCYGLPDKNDYKAYIEHILSLPLVHPPEVFGLHTNAGITRDLQNSGLLLNALLKAYGDLSSSGGGETDKTLLTLCSDILHKLPKLFDIEAAARKYPVDYNESMNTVLVQELERFNKLLKRITDTLTNMLKIIEGLVTINPDYEKFAASLLLLRIPDLWKPVSYPSLKNLPSYVNDFIARLDFLNKWYMTGKPTTFWLSGFYFTQAFLTGVKQNYARRYTIAIDKLTFDFEILKDTRDKAATEGAYIYGLFTDGARWDKEVNLLAELYPKILNDTMSPIWFKPILNSEFEVGTRYPAPVYKTAERKGTLSTTGHSTNYVLPILLDTDIEISHWIKRSVALLCQLS
ncbi:unnamed protein product [Phyllotreta striolata]|uniref:AAA+ ATPase domain-containing protein n=1 Tax=Phyllotreta striolata TaxID=444603 RepID=A0A9N9TRQ5_PHYSR|nr:unnamed protein product [Phyllotreta striolata]